MFEAGHSALQHHDQLQLKTSIDCTLWVSLLSQSLFSSVTSGSTDFTTLETLGFEHKQGVLQALQKSIPHDFELMGQRKGFVRYRSAPLQQLVKQHAEALQSRETALAGILQVL